MILLLVGLMAAADVDFDTPCFRDIPKKCGDIIVDPAKPMTEEEKKVLVCRTREMMRCIKEQR